MQVERLRDRWLAEPEFVADVLISSHYSRALETADILAPALGELPVVVIEGFGEHDPGEAFDGLHYEELVEKLGPLDRDSDPYILGYPGGETVADFHYRVGKTIAETVQQHEGKTIVVTCHGGVVDVALRHALRTPPTGSFDLWTINTSITEFKVVKPGRWRLVRYNDYAHLTGLPGETASDL